MSVISAHLLAIVSDGSGFQLKGEMGVYTSHHFLDLLQIFVDFAVV